mgnify:CR=1 FL=1
MRKTPVAFLSQSNPNRLQITKLSRTISTPLIRKACVVQWLRPTSRLGLEQVFYPLVQLEDLEGAIALGS